MKYKVSVDFYKHILKGLDILWYKEIFFFIPYCFLDGREEI